jgi:hypothetical protein
VKHNFFFIGARRGRSPDGTPRAQCGTGLVFRRVALTALLAAFAFAFAAAAKAGFPEPDLVWYGKVFTTSGGATIRLTTGTLVWRIEPLAGGPAIVRTTALTNINQQFSFVLRVPCETPEPGVSNSIVAVNLSSPPNRYRRLTVTLDGQPLSLISAASEFSPLLADRGRSERLDLQLGTPLVDTDGDGLGDAWELQHFGSLSATPTGDPDGDGVNNLGEFRAGTDPTDPGSRFEVVEISKVPNGVSIQWSSQSDRSYRVRRSPTLLAAPASYVIVQEGLAATPPMNQFIDTITGSAGSQFFYLIEIEE